MGCCNTLSESDIEDSLVQSKYSSLKNTYIMSSIQGNDSQSLFVVYAENK